MKVKKELLSGFNHSKFLYMFVALTVIAGSFIYGKISADDTSVNIAVNASMQESQESKMKSIVINEVCSRSYSDIYDILGEKYDYIELYNMGTDSVILSDLYLSDDKTDLWKCGIYTGIIPANGYYTIFASAETTNRLSVKSNLNFKISAGETIYLSYKGAVIDSVTVPELDFRQVYARGADGSGDFKVSSGSPNSSNNGVEFVSQPTFSVESGFYDESFTLEIKAENGCEIYYTLDSSEPTADSIKYERPLTIVDASPNENYYSALTNISAADYPYTPPDFPVDKATVVRAVAVDKQGNISAVSTSSYFVGFQDKEGYNNIGVLSLVADPDDLFGEEKGIYITGEKYDKKAAEIIEKYNAQTEPEYDENGDEIALGTLLWSAVYETNFSQRGRNTERKASINVYTKDKELSFSGACGIRVGGNSSQAQPKKTLKLYSRNIYDGYGFLPDELLDNDFIYEQWLMLAPADNFRKSFPNNLVTDRAISTQDYKLFQVFINGEYWGSYNVMERYTEEYVSKHYSVNEDNIAVTKGSFISNENPSAQWNEPHRYAESRDLSESIRYEKISEIMDIQSFIDWVCTTVYTADTDTTEAVNLHMWRSVEASFESGYADGKWRWMLYDTDTSISKNHIELDSFTKVVSNWNTQSIIEGTLFSNLIKNESFVRQFVLSFMDMANYNFKAERVLPMIDEVYSVYSAANALDHERWGSYSQFEKQVSSAREFFTNRYDYAVQHLADNFNLTGALATITLATPDINAGDITLNTITPEMPEGVWSGKYYTDYPVTVTANPKPGYKFVGWELRGGTTDNLLTDSTISVSFSGDNAITAVFESI